MRGTAPHQLDEVPILLGTVGVSLDVADQFGIYLARGIKTKRSFNPFVLQVAVNRLRATDYFDARVILGAIFCQHAGICIAVIAADDHEARNAESVTVLDNLRKLLVFFQLGAARADDIKAAGVAVALSLIHISEPT